MPIEVVSTGLLEPTIVRGSMVDLLNELNLAAAKGHQFVLMEDLHGMPVAFETRNIAKLRELEEDDEDAFLGG